MKPYVAGAMAAAAVVLAALAGWALFGPPFSADAPRPAASDATVAPAAERIAGHGRALAGDAHGMRYVGTEPSLARPGQGYQVTFSTTDQQPARAADDAANAARQAAWQRRFCDGELQAEMAAQGVAVVTGRVVDGQGRTQYVADCVAGGAPQQVGPGGPLL
ncbi:hypothetical protein [Pseudoduganella albidiflava]|uniref:Uncharacterized protein n=1 Tax=Pseudoduganella albidiflava TaxID=321983 RepID=A0A411X006_9BURK|nr:hypothetical protein [Pseudoduganella albidiflava]QBI02175.1 hypothetical protein EYF70_15940 [Pseudoduganella albidiflava]GGY59954.1 hypothetical protein GCM10007387_48120 [Pseudoduganella albidiflava]